MKQNPYESYSPEEANLRDFLAIDRTILANERTFLAYVRTALAFSLAGASILKLIPELTPTWRTIAWIFIPAGIIVFFIGLFRFIVVHKSVNKARK